MGKSWVSIGYSQNVVLSLRYFRESFQYFIYIYMWLCHLYHYWQKWHKLNSSHNSSGNSVMLKKLVYASIIHGCRFQIYSQISHKSNAFVDIRFPIIN